MTRRKADARHFWALSLACLAAAIAVAILWQRLSWSLPAGSLVFAVMAVARMKAEQKTRTESAPTQLTDQSELSAGTTPRRPSEAAQTSTPDDGVNKGS